MPFCSLFSGSTKKIQNPKSAISNPKSKIHWAFGIKFYQPASFLRDFKVNTIQAFSVAFTFSPVTALAANEGALSW